MLLAKRWHPVREVEPILADWRSEAFVRIYADEHHIVIGFRKAAGLDAEIDQLVVDACGTGLTWPALLWPAAKSNTFLSVLSEPGKGGRRR